jgi:uncharacterized protein YegL
MKRIGFSLICTLVIFSTSQANASLLQLGFLIDASGSVGATDFDTVRTGIANAFDTVLPTDGSVEVSLIRFANGSTVIVAPTVIDSVATRNAVVSLVTGMAYTGGGTVLPNALDTLTSQITNSAEYDAENKIIYNIVTDGNPDSITNSIASRNAAIDAGVDEISAELLGAFVDPDQFEGIVYPTDNGFDAFDPGFIFLVADFEDFADAFESNLIIATAPVPEPSTLVLAAFGLLGMLGFRRRRRTV